MFKKAVRESIMIKIALIGPSGSGKTYSALKLARGMGGKTALIDTENNSASMYDHVLDFDTCPIGEPYTTKKFIDAINFAVKEGYENIIIDSITHEWSGSGGILSRKTIKDSIGGNSYTNWKEFTIEHDLFISTILNAKANVICTMRSKIDYIMEINEKGKQAPRKVGLAPIQRDNVEYEYSIVFDIAQNHMATVSKDRTGIFDGRIFTINEEIGAEIKAFISSGVAPKKTIKDSILEKTLEIKDTDLRNKITETVLNETDLSKMNKYLSRVDDILLKQRVDQDPLMHHQV